MPSSPPDAAPPPDDERGGRRRHRVDAWAAQNVPEPQTAGASLARASKAGARRLTGSVRSLFETGGVGFRNLAITQVFSTAADTLVAIGLAGTLFFSVPTAEARGNVALYLLLTVAPFAVIGPVLGRVLDRTPVATRRMLVLAALGRAVFAVAALGRLDSLWLFPVAFMLLVLSRVHGITRHALLPLALDAPRALVAANARLAWIGVLAGGVAAGLGFGALAVLDANGPLALAALAALGAAAFGRRLPEPDGAATRFTGEPWRGLRLQLPREVRLAQLATAGVRVFNGFLLLLLAFELQQTDAGLLDFGALLAAAGAGFAVASRLVPALARRVREEPMVLAALAITAAAAFSAGQWFGLLAAAALAGAAGVAWGVAKLAFDGLLQATVPADRRGAAFTRSETMFSVAWVLGAIIPTAIPMPASVGLALAGFAALAAQIVYVTVLLVPESRPRRPDDPEDDTATLDAPPAT
ncbi:MAG: hypothetical protein EA387_07200 [Nitriliruptor sp.]|nr:MAG: hypothetical protein EA387_07200 [Nitriliruptor sp.]